MDRIIVYRNFKQVQDALFNLSYLKEKMLQYIDPITLDQPTDGSHQSLLKKADICFIRNVFMGAKIYN